ncbi:MAG TPA: hypothetical protein VMU76_00720 [Acidimicrobiales bacterium]|nr:hypothetical protein [Acidimicrobiales bacterium]
MPVALKATVPVNWFSAQAAAVTGRVVFDGFGEVVVDDEVDADEQAAQKMTIPRESTRRTECEILAVMRRKPPTSMDPDRRIPRPNVRSDVTGDAGISRAPTYRSAPPRRRRSFYGPAFRAQRGAR